MWRAGVLKAKVTPPHAPNANRWLAETMNLYHGDCLEILPTFPPASVEAIITDLPYGTTQSAWDSVIPLDEMWKQVKRVLKVSGVFITTGSQPFTSILTVSNLEWFKYDIDWMKDKATGHLNAEVAPMRKHENILVFGDGRITYNPQITMKPKENIRPISRRAPTDSYGKYNETAERNIPLNMSYPTSIVYCHTTNHGERGFHPTQKPVELYEYLIRTYTNAGETVLDIAMGSGTTGVAAIQTGRNFIGIEKEQKYFEIASRRIAQAPQPLFTEPPRQPTQREPDLKLESGKLSGFE